MEGMEKLKELPRIFGSALVLAYVVAVAVACWCSSIHAYNLPTVFVFRATLRLADWFAALVSPSPLFLGCGGSTTT